MGIVTIKDVRPSNKTYEEKNASRCTENGTFQAPRWCFVHSYLLHYQDRITEISGKIIITTINIVPAYAYYSAQQDHDRQCPTDQHHKLQDTTGRASPTLRLLQLKLKILRDSTALERQRKGAGDGDCNGRSHRAIIHDPTRNQRWRLKGRHHWQRRCRFED
uniref:Adenylyltransferase and sulfurtransferase MOCS3 Molybdenum cofactor synthesis protein 3 n=1 Tax=Rhizophora mucronata TaxID=61149 RepID=A0A2P2KV76_RHIMU